ncbi:aminopeptidase P family protein [uncultured Kiloniella sp.]|uniref:aminopeptidase P family protein n=1 Tax=uncultured Kiloniella sp. TaxID=1133091 RepID=UPI002602B3F7|nr:aminopeptidase P family protein [uncultured Kiloniella sp.]
MPETATLDHESRLKALRIQLANEGVDGFIVPRTDEHQGEYVPPQAQRLGWLSGFTGSAGLATVLMDKAAIFVDGRYTIQVRQEVSEHLFAYQHLVEEPAHQWLEENVSAGMRIAYDPWLQSENQIKSLRKGVEKAGGELVPLSDNPLDKVWLDQPARPCTKSMPYDLKYAGQSSQDKRKEIGELLTKSEADCAVLSLPDSVAWLLNVRGEDVDHTPLVLSFAVVHADGNVQWFVDSQKVTSETLAALDNQVEVAEPGTLETRLEAFAREGKRVLVDPATCPERITALLEKSGANLVRAMDPVSLPKARKNTSELDGIRAAHIRDGAAMVRFLKWVTESATERADTDNPVTEMEAVYKLLSFREEVPLFKDSSFDTISGAGPNGALCHYKVSDESSLPLKRDEIFLIDSGGQYLDGTTDITRTVIIGTPNAEMKDRFTRVLMGHIALSTAKFPKGTNGIQLDSLARRPLWDAGLDYDHGTGHGVGCFLGVHEGPQRIAKASSPVALEPGMFLSNEPGYYKAGEYGIRIENLIIVRDAGKMVGLDTPLYDFETVTLCPIDLRLIEPALMSAGDIKWLNDYHDWVRKELTPLLDAEHVAWLEMATKAI